MNRPCGPSYIMSLLAVCNLGETSLIFQNEKHKEIPNVATWVFGPVVIPLLKKSYSRSSGLMPLNNKQYLVVRVKGCRSPESCVFKRQCKLIFKKGKMDLVYGNFVRDI